MRKSYTRGSFYEDTWSLTNGFFEKIATNPYSIPIEVTNSLGQKKVFSQDEVINMWNNAEWKQSKNGTKVMVKILPF